MEYLVDPVHGSISTGKPACGIICLHLDDLFMTVASEFYEKVVKYLHAHFQICSEDKNDIFVVGQRIRWIQEKEKSQWFVQVDQSRGIDELTEAPAEKHLKDSMSLTPALHTAFRRIVGQVNWPQPRTQYLVCYRFSRSASCCPAPTIPDLKVANKLTRSQGRASGLEVLAS